MEYVVVEYHPFPFSAIFKNHGGTGSEARMHRANYAIATLMSAVSEIVLPLSLSLSLSVSRRIDRTVIALSRIPFCGAAVLERRARSYTFGTH